MKTITPRWEWRNFGRRFGGAEDQLAALPPQGVQDSDEIYLLGPGGGNVKLRDGLVDIKALQQVDDEGLEQWLPVLKAAFPLDAEQVATVCEALLLPLPPTPQRVASLDELLAAVDAPGRALRAVPVHKRRTRFQLDGCQAELTDVQVESRRTRTLALESEDAQALLAARRHLGLEAYLNTAYPLGLAALLEGEGERFAAIDVGTNSVKFHVGECMADVGWQQRADRAVVTRLGEGFGTQRVITAAAVERTVAALQDMVDEARMLGVRAIAAVGTAGLRIADNSAEVRSQIHARCGLRVEVLSGEDEARLAYLGARSGLGRFDGSLVVFDTGGGSSQFSFGCGQGVDERFSVDVGAARFTEAFQLDAPVSPRQLGAALAAIAAELSRLDGRPVPAALVGMGGVVTNLAAVALQMAAYDADRIQGATLQRAEVERQIELYRTLDLAGRRAVVGLQPQREPVILAGACIVRTVMHKLGVEQLTVSDRGLRHGLLAERFAC